MKYGNSMNACYFFNADYRTVECVHSAKIARRIPGCLPRDGTDGRQPLSSDPDGLRP